MRRGLVYDRNGESTQWSRTSRFCGLAAMLCLIAIPAPPQQPGLPASPPPGIDIRTDIQPRKATVGDVLRIEISASLPAGFSAALTPLRGQIGEFSVLEFQNVPAAEKPGSGKAKTLPAVDPRVIARIAVALYRPGSYEFPSLPVVIRSADGKEHSAPSPPAKVEIGSVLGPQDEALRDLKKQAEIEAPVRWLLWLSLGLLLLIALLTAWLLRRKARRATLPHAGIPQLDPFVLAEAELRDLAGRDLLKRGLVKHFYVALSDIVRRIIEAGYSMQTSEKTTSEIMEALRENGNACEPSADIERIESFLIECDLVKFARYVPGAKESDAALNSAFAILDWCKQRVRLASAAATSSGEGTGVSSG